MSKIVEKIRKSIRITTNDFDDQISGYVEFVHRDLVAHAMDEKNWSTVDPLIVGCCEMYVKSAFDYEGKGEWYEKRYRALRDNMVTMMRYIDA